MTNPQTEHQRGGGHHRHGHGFHGRGRGGKVRRGEARYLLLDALREGPKHGYEIIKTLEERSSGQYTPSPGTVYPTLQFLEDLGLVNANQETERRVYRLTEKGRAELDAHAQTVHAFWSRFQQSSTSVAGQAEISFLQEELHLLEKTVWRAASEASGPDDVETIRRIRQVVEQCRNEVRRIVTEPKKQSS